MGWYDDLPDEKQTLARLNPAGLAVVHTEPFAPETGKQFRVFRYIRKIVEHVQPLLAEGGKGMVSMPPRHGKSWLLSVYTPAWYLLCHPTRHVLLTGYAEDLSAGFSAKARDVVDDLGHLFGVRVNPKRKAASDWSVQYLDDGGEWCDGGGCIAAGVSGAIPGKGANLIVMDDVVKGGHADTSQHQMQKAYDVYRSVIETRQEPTADGPATLLLVMTRWATADIAGRLLEDEGDEWRQLVLPAIAKANDPAGREEGEALCPSRFPLPWLEAKRDSSTEGGLIFQALYQQEPIPFGGAVFRRDHFPRWSWIADGRAIELDGGAHAVDRLTLHFATVDPALRSREANDSTGLMVWAITLDGSLVLLEDRTKRMRGTTDLLPECKRLETRYPGLTFHVEDVAHGTEVIRAMEREGLRVVPLKADRDKLTRALGCVPALDAGRVFFPTEGMDVLVNECLAFPGAAHDDRVDCIAYAVQVFLERVRHIDAEAYVRSIGEAYRGIEPSWTMRMRERYHEGPTVQPMPMDRLPFETGPQDVHPDRLPPRQPATGPHRFRP